MSTHFQIVTPSASLPPSARSGKAEDRSDAFAGLLGLVGASPKTATAPAGVDPADEPAETTKRNETAKDFLKALKELRKALEAGEKPDQSLLDRLAQDADALQSDIDGADDPSALVQSLAGAANLATAILAPALAPVVALGGQLAQQVVGSPTGVETPPDLAALGDKLKALAGQLGATDADLSGKLADLADELTSGKLPQALIDKLGLNAPDAGTQEALQALLSPKAAATPPAPPATASLVSFPGPQLAAPAAPSDVPPGEADATEAVPKLEKPAPTPPTGAPVPHQADAPTGEDGPAPIFTIDGKTDTAGATPPASAPAAAAPTTSAPRVLPAAAYATPQVNLPQVAFEIARQIQNGTSRFEIRLDPAELGRVDVRMHVDGAGNVHARLTVERSETLDLFQRDQRGLERALQQAGVDAGKTSLEFSLRQGPFDRPQQGFGAPAPVPGFSAAAKDEPVAPSITLYRGTASPGGINIFV